MRGPGQRQNGGSGGPPHGRTFGRGIPQRALQQVAQQHRIPGLGQQQTIFAIPDELRGSVRRLNNPRQPASHGLLHRVGARIIERGVHKPCRLPIHRHEVIHLAQHPNS